MLLEKQLDAERMPEDGDDPKSNAVESSDLGNPGPRGIKGYIRGLMRKAVFVVMMAVGACSGPKVVTSEEAFETAKKEEAEANSVAQRKAAEAVDATVARQLAGKQYASDVLSKATAAEAQLASIKAEADRLKAKACELNQDLCPKAPSQAKEAPAEELYVDVDLTDWDKPDRISPYPKGWKLVRMDDDVNRLILTIDGKVASWLDKKTAESGGCWRFKTVGVVNPCPTTVE